MGIKGGGIERGFVVGLVFAFVMKERRLSDVTAERVILADRRGRERRVRATNHRQKSSRSNFKVHLPMQITYSTIPKTFKRHPWE